MKYIKGDIIEAFNKGEIDVIAHQCNCTTGHGKGFAKILANEFPIINRQSPQRLLGEAMPYYLGGGRAILNMYAQYNPGPCRAGTSDSFEHRLKMLKRCLRIANHFFHYERIGIPLIASGLAASKELKGDMTDLEYFKKYIAPTVEEYLPNAIVYYL